MGIFSFNKIPGHRVFNYKPRYYDPEKDVRDAIIRRAQMEAGLIGEVDMDDDVERAKMRITKAYHSRAVVKDYKRSSTRRSNIRVVVIIIFLSALAYILLNFNIGSLVKMFE